MSGEGGRGGQEGSERGLGGVKGERGGGVKEWEDQMDSILKKGQADADQEQRKLVQVWRH